MTKHTLFKSCIIFCIFVFAPIINAQTIIKQGDDLVVQEVTKKELMHFDNALSQLNDFDKTILSNETIFALLTHTKKSYTKKNASCKFFAFEYLHFPIRMTSQCSDVMFIEKNGLIHKLYVNKTYFSQKNWFIEVFYRILPFCFLLFIGITVNEKSSVFDIFKSYIFICVTLFSSICVKYFLPYFLETSHVFGYVIICTLSVLLSVFVIKFLLLKNINKNLFLLFVMSINAIVLLPIPWHNIMIILHIIALTCVAFISFIIYQILQKRSM